MGSTVTKPWDLVNNSLFSNIEHLVAINLYYMVKTGIAKVSSEIN